MIVDVLGLGESLALYDNAGDITFGVNDIFSKQKVDYLVCVDKMEAFTPERLETIKQSTGYCAFISHLDEWKFMPHYFKIEIQKPFPNVIADLDSVAIPKSCFSPYIAVGLAYKMFKPTIIRLFGVDMTSHPNLSKQTERIKKHWAAMVAALNAKGCEVEVYGSGVLVSY
jgi:hypothetical protein